MNNKPVSDKCEEEVIEDRHFKEFILKAIERKDHNVINHIPFSELGIAFTHIQPSNEENEVNPGGPSVLHGSYLHTNISNDQQSLHNIKQHISQGYETGKESHIQFDDIKRRNINENITTWINKPNIYQTINSSQSSGISSDILQTSQELSQNFQSGNRTQCIETGSKSYDFSWKEGPINQMALENCSLTCNYQAFEAIKEPYCNQGIQIFGDIGKNTLFTTSQKNISYISSSEITQNDKEFSKCLDSVASNTGLDCSEEDTLSITGRYSYRRNEKNSSLHVDPEFQTIEESTSFNQRIQILGDVGKNTVFATRKKIASNINISEIAQNDRDPSKISDSVAYEGKNVGTSEGIDVVPGPSGYQRNENDPNLLNDIQSLHEAEKRNVLTCKVCKGEITNHKETNVENSPYECCICNYKDYEHGNLHIHSFTHLNYKFCNICFKDHTEGDLHDGPEICTVCGKKCDCRTDLTEHFLDDKNHFREHCWNCFRSFKKHGTHKKDKIFYACCFCKYEGSHWQYLQTHSIIHLPKRFCKVCREEYSAKEKGSHQSEKNCTVCGLNFKCKRVFEDHFIDHYLANLCIFCNKKISDHENCCRCYGITKNALNLKNHLYSHADFHVFKCVRCNQGFGRKGNLNSHLELCSAVPFGCKSCGARFPTRDFLNTHCFVKHALKL